MKFYLLISIVLFCNLKTNAQNRMDIANSFNTSVPFFFPLGERDFITISSPFGYRIHPILHTIKKHRGIDLVAAKGKAVYASGDGKVTNATISDSYGKFLKINHLNGMETVYAHLMRRFVKLGDLVKQGQLIGLVGETGLATGPHLHFEIYLKGKRIDPLLFWNIILKKIKSTNNNKEEVAHG